jgi:MFS family permease
MNVSSLLKMSDTSVMVKALLFGAGFAILSIEILGVRILAPSVGASMPVWGAVIGVTLLGGAIGYYAGGALADAGRSRRALIILSVLSGLAIILLPTFNGVIAPYIQALPFAVGALVASGALFLFPTTMLSALITYTIRLHVRDLDTIGRVHGDLYAIATFGSIAGVFATSYLLIPFYAVSHILYGLGMMVFLLGIFLYARKVDLL